MTSENIVAERYALSLYLNMKKLDRVYEIFDEINCFLNLTRISKSVEKLLSDKFAPKKNKLVFCNTLMSKAKISDLLKRFIMVLIDKKRLYLLKKITVSLERIINKENDVKVLELIIAKQLEDDSLNEVKDRVMEYFSYTDIKFSISYNNNILGGMVIKKDSKILDLSLLSKIKKVKFLIKDANLKLTN